MCPQESRREAGTVGWKRMRCARKAIEHDGDINGSRKDGRQPSAKAEDVSINPQFPSRPPGDAGALLRRQYACWVLTWHTCIIFSR